MGNVKQKDELLPVTISRAAATAGLTAKAVRLYEARGLIAAPTRTASGYRLYTADDIGRLRFIAAARSIGLHIDQIAHILSTARDGEPPCAATRAVLDQRIAEIDRLITAVAELRATLTAARETTGGTKTDATICPMIERGSN